MSNCCIYHHLGLGDHFICNGLVREIAKKYNKVFVLCKKHNFQSVNAMYYDNQKIEAYIISDDAEAQAVVESFKRKGEKVECFGYMRPGWMDNNKTWDQSFYDQANIDFKKRWSSFALYRDLKKEKEVFEKNVCDKEYVFLHEDKKRGYIINRKEYINDRIIEPILGVTDNIIDYYKIIKEAKEIHCIDSCFLIFIDSLCLEFKKLFFHKYARPRETESEKSAGFTTLKHNWKIL